jgi:GNAT superfamily N-acetyltransferase
MHTITVRQAVLADLDALASLFDEYRQFYGKTSDLPAARSFLLARFNHGESVLFLAQMDEAPVGFTQLYPSFSSASLARVLILNDLFVREQARRSGAATKLLAHAAEYAISVGAVRLSLNTQVTNEAAQTLYRAVGWKRDEDFHAYHHALGG